MTSGARRLWMAFILVALLAATGKPGAAAGSDDRIDHVARSQNSYIVHGCPSSDKVDRCECESGLHCTPMVLLIDVAPSPPLPARRHEPALPQLPVGIIISPEHGPPKRVS